jgi:hypothetical protein
MHTLTDWAEVLSSFLIVGQIQLSTYSSFFSSEYINICETFFLQYIELYTLLMTQNTTTFHSNARVSEMQRQGQGASICKAAYSHD